MHFEVQFGGEVLGVSVVYRVDEYSFGAERLHGPFPSAFTSVQVNELQLQLDEEGRVLYADGYCPHTAWSETQANPPFAHRGALFVRGVSLVAGVSVALSSRQRWPVSVNRKTRWVCVGAQLAAAACTAVEFAASSVAVLESDVLKSLWLKPTELPF